MALAPPLPSTLFYMAQTKNQSTSGFSGGGAHDVHLSHWGPFGPEILGLAPPLSDTIVAWTASSSPLSSWWLRVQVKSQYFISAIITWIHGSLTAVPSCCFIRIVPTIVFTVTHPSLGDAAAVVTRKLVRLTCAVEGRWKATTQTIKIMTFHCIFEQRSQRLLKCCQKSIALGIEVSGISPNACYKRISDLCNHYDEII